MDAKKMLVLSLILLFMLMPIALAAEGDFTIPSVKKDLTVNDDGSAVVIEEIVYDIEGSVNGVYRNIPLSNNQSIRNISVETPGYYNKLEIDREKDSTNIKVWLYEDEAKTRKTNNAKVRVIYHYTIRKGVRIYNDIVDLQYMTWGDNWDSKVDKMESTIHIPGSKDNTENWNNPEDNVVSSQWTSDNTLTTKLENIGAHTSFEQRILMPKSYIKSSTYARVIHMDAKKQIEDDQRKYQEEQNNKQTITSLLWTVLGILVALPFGIYALFGREPKIDYNKEYEYDLPTNATPIEVHALVPDNVGSINNNAMYATILDLIDKKYYKIVVNDRDNTIIRQTDKDTTSLKEYELSLMEFLSSFAEDGDISIGYVGRRSHRQKFQTFRHKWNEQVREEIRKMPLSRYFDDRGSNYLVYLGGIFFLLFVIDAILVEFRLVPEYLGWVLLAAMFVFMFGFVILVTVPNRIPGRWTPEGKEFYEKWKNFEKYIKDYSLIEERPPASVQVWGRYLVYASALGCADEVTKNMKKYFNSMEIVDDSFDTDTVASFTYYNGFSHIESSFNILGQSESSDSGSNIGSSGSGGFGGGGGGTF